MTSQRRRSAARLLRDGARAVCRALVASGSLAALPARGADLQWDGDGSGSPAGGSGIWDATLKHWWDGSAYVAWDSAAGDNAVFGGAGSGVSVDAMTARGLTFNANSYAIYGSLTLTGAGNGGPGPYAVQVTQAAHTVRVYGSLASTSGELQKTGAGTLAFYGSTLPTSLTITCQAGTVLFGGNEVVHATLAGSGAFGVARNEVAAFDGGPGSASGSFVLSGVARLTQAAALGNTTVVPDGGTLAAAGTGGTLTFDRPLAPGGSLNVAGGVTVSSPLKGDTVVNRSSYDGLTTLATLSGNNASWTGTLNVSEGELRATSLALPAGNITVGTSAGSNRAVLYTSGSFTRSIGTNAGQIRFLGGASAAAPAPSLGAYDGDAPLLINFGGKPTPDTYDWSTPGLTGASGAFSLVGNATLMNPLRLGAAGSGLRELRFGGATLAGAISNSGGTWGLKLTGPVTLSGANTYNGDTFFDRGGSLTAASRDAVSPKSRLVFDAFGGTFTVADGVTARVPQIALPAPSAWYGAPDVLIDSRGGVIELTGGLSFPRWDPFLPDAGSRLRISGTFALPAGNHAFLIGKHDPAAPPVMAARLLGPGAVLMSGDGTLAFQGDATADSTADIVLQGGVIQVDQPVPATGAPPAANGPLGSGTLSFPTNAGRLLGKLGGPHPSITNPIAGSGTVWIENLTHTGPIALAAGARLRGDCVLLGSLSSPAAAPVVIYRDLDTDSLANQITLGGPNALGGPVALQNVRVMVTHPQALSGGTDPITIEAGSTLTLACAAPVTPGRPIFLDGTTDAGGPVPTIFGSGSLAATVSVQNVGVIQSTFGGDLHVSQVVSRTGVPAGVWLRGKVRVDKLDVGGVTLNDATLTLAPADANVRPQAARITAVAMTHGLIDVSDRGLVIDYVFTSGLAQAGADLKAGRNAGDWMGTQGITSSTAARDAARLAVGFGEAADVLGISGTQVATWMGRDVDATAVLMRCTLKGDADLDGIVDFDDLVRLAQNYNTRPGTPAWSHGDFDFDGDVDFDDLVQIAQSYNTNLPSASPPAAPAQLQADWAAAVAAVPEPAGALIAVLALPLLSRRHRRHPRARA